MEEPDAGDRGGQSVQMILNSMSDGKTGTVFTDLEENWWSRFILSHPPPFKTGFMFGD